MLTDEEISNEPSALRLISVEETEGGVYGFFSSIRVNTIREIIDEDNLSEELKEELSQYQEIIGVRNIRTQAIDVIYIPDRQTHIDIRIDFPAGNLADQADRASSILVNRINQIATQDVLGLPVNLFPLINHMYNSPREGKVVELAFGTTTRSLKHERMRRGAVDLRREVYHEGGKAALQTDIEPHKISIEYSRQVSTDVNSKPEITLASNYRTVANGNPTLASAIIRRCTGAEDFDYVRRRIRHFLQQNAPDIA